MGQKKHMFSQNCFHENAKIDEPCTVSARKSGTPCDPRTPIKFYKEKKITLNKNDMCADCPRAQPALHGLEEL